MLQYPSEHKEVVRALLNGEFLLFPEKLFTIVDNEKDFYTDFFKNSFDYNLEVRSEFAFLTSNNTVERDTRDFAIFLSIFCRELELEGKRFREQIDFATFYIDEVEQLLKNSSKIEIIESIELLKDFRRFLNRWNKKNVITLTGNSFKFTKAVNLFFEFAVNVANGKLKETNKTKTETTEQ